MLRLNWIVLFGFLVGWQTQAMAVGCLSPPGDMDGSGEVNVADMQCAILTNLYVMAGDLTQASPSCAGENLYRADINCNGEVSVTDVMTVLSLAFGLPMNPLVDGDGNGCPDSCDDQIMCDGVGDCDDGDLCTADSCSMAFGCLYEPEIADSDDDGAPDCIDGCPDDPAQTDAALCNTAGGADCECDGFPYPDTVGTPCTVDLSMCSEDEKAGWGGLDSLSGGLNCGTYGSEFGMLCMATYPNNGNTSTQGWPVEPYDGWWCGEVVSVCE